MAFVNEYVSEENIEKYDLKGLWRKVTYCELPEGAKYAWTWDSEIESFYIPMRSGREEYSHEKTGVFFFNNKLWLVKIAKVGGSANFSKKPYEIVWSLLSIHNLDGEEAPTDEVMRVFKDALIGYKAIGLSVLGDLDVDTSFEF